jgi:hypothetical protein
MPPPPDRCALCGSNLSSPQIQQVSAPGGPEGGAWGTVCPSCGRLWITTAAWENLLAWHDGDQDSGRRAALVRNAIKRHDRGQVVPIGLRFLEDHSAP